MDKTAVSVIAMKFLKLTLVIFRYAFSITGLFFVSISFLIPDIGKKMPAVASLGFFLLAFTLPLMIRAYKGGRGSLPNPNLHLRSDTIGSDISKKTLENFTRRTPETAPVAPPKLHPGLVPAPNLFFDKDCLLHRDDGPAVTTPNGTQSWYKHGKLHRDGGPAKITPPNSLQRGAEKWFREGKVHRDDGPAIITQNGTKKWYQNDVLHRTDGPAIEYPNGGKEYWIRGRLHRVEGPAIDTQLLEAWLFEGKLHRPEDKPALSYKVKSAGLYNYMKLFSGFLKPFIGGEDGERQWWKKGLLHREHGPAVEKADGTQKWFKNGLLHREGKPAVEYPGGSNEWWLNGRLHREDGPAVEVAKGYFIFHTGKGGITRYFLHDRRELVNRVEAVERPIEMFNHKIESSYTTGGQTFYRDVYTYRNRGESHFGKEWWIEGRLIKKEEMPLENEHPAPPTGSD